VNDTPFIEFRGAATTAGGTMLALNPASVSVIYAEWSKDLKEQVLCLLLNSNRIIRIRESDAAEVLETLGLSEVVEQGLHLDLEKDLS
jgi:hypothetical protein